MFIVDHFVNNTSYKSSAYASPNPSKHTILGTSAEQGAIRENREHSMVIASTHETT